MGWDIGLMIQKRIAWTIRRNGNQETTGPHKWSKLKQRKAKRQRWLIFTFSQRLVTQGEGEIKKHLTCEVRGGIWTWDFWSTADCFDHLATVSFRREMEHATTITNLPTPLFYCTFNLYVHDVRGATIGSKMLQPFLAGLRMILRFAVCTNVAPFMLGKSKWGSLTSSPTLCIAGILLHQAACTNKWTFTVLWTTCLPPNHVTPTPSNNAWISHPIGKPTSWFCHLKCPFL